MGLAIFYFGYAVFAGGFILLGVSNTMTDTIIHENPQAVIKFLELELHSGLSRDPIGLQYVKNVYYINGWKFSEPHILSTNSFQHYAGKYNKIRMLPDYSIIEKLVTFNSSYPLIEGMLLPFDKSFFGHVSSALPWKFKATSCGPDENFRIFYNLFSEGALTKYSYAGKVCHNGFEIKLINDINYLKKVVSWLDEVDQQMKYLIEINLPNRGFEAHWLESSGLIEEFLDAPSAYHKECKAFTIWFHSWADSKDYAYLLQLFKMPTSIIDTTGFKSCRLHSLLVDDSNYGITSVLVERSSYIKPNLTVDQISSILNSSLTRIVTTVDFLETERYISVSSLRCYVARALHDLQMDELAKYLRYDTVTKHVQFWSPDELRIVREAKTCVSALSHGQELSGKQYNQELTKVITTISDAVVNRRSDVWLNHIWGSEPFTLPYEPLETTTINMCRTIEYVG